MGVFSNRKNRVRVESALRMKNDLTFGFIEIVAISKTESKGQ